jgi:carboxypeptidase C (cathepsin A)
LDAFHVRSTFFEVDNAEGDFDYTPTEPDLQPFYKEMNGKLKILIYNGDTDPAITSFATQNWTSHLGFDEISHWRPWTIDGCQQMGGYVERYEGNFDFLTIRGAGHMVPTYKPAASFAFLKAWLQDEEYPIFDKNCTQPPLSLSSSYGNDESTGTTMTDAVVAETY